MKASIYEVDFVCGDKTLVEKFTGSLEALRAKLVRLQADWCESENPRVSYPKSNIIQTNSNCDYGYLAFILE